eukprot:scaffold197039_cov34-Tisochrysis_lutea.AAC.1
MPGAAHRPESVPARVGPESAEAAPRSSRAQVERSIMRRKETRRARRERAAGTSGERGDAHPRLAEGALQREAPSSPPPTEL